jgi:hypothetical protein
VIKNVFSVYILFVDFFDMFKPCFPDHSRARGMHEVRGETSLHLLSKFRIIEMNV